MATTDVSWDLSKPSWTRSDGKTQKTPRETGEYRATHVDLAVVLPSDILLCHMVIIMVGHHCVKSFHDFCISDLPPLLDSEKSIRRRIQRFRVLVVKIQHVDAIRAFRRRTMPSEIKSRWVWWIPKLRRNKGSDIWVLEFGIIVLRGRGGWTGSYREV